MRHQCTKRRATYKPPETIGETPTSGSPAVLIGPGMPASRPLTLEYCSAVTIMFEPDGLTGVTVWRDGPKLTRPVKPGQRIRDLRPGNEVTFKGERYVVRSIEPFR